MLRKHIRTLGGVIETGVELVGLEQDESKVIAHLKHSEGGEEHAECFYLVGADGAKGTSIPDGREHYHIPDLRIQVEHVDSSESISSGKAEMLIAFFRET